eukprot:gene11780-biopygen13957
MLRRAALHVTQLYTTASRATRNWLGTNIRVTTKMAKTTACVARQVARPHPDHLPTTFWHSFFSFAEAGRHQENNRKRNMCDEHFTDYATQ